MAHTDACKIQVCQFVKKCVDNGLPVIKACQEAERESDGIPAETIRYWWKQSQKEIEETIGGNSPMQPTTCNDDEIKEKPIERRDGAGLFEKGTAPGPGRPPKHKPMMANYPKVTEIISPSFKSAYDLFFEQVAKEKTSGWKTTEKKVVLQQETNYDRGNGSNGQGRRISSEHEMISRCITAWNAFRVGETRSILKYFPSKPIPRAK